MPVAIGETFERYEIESLIGRGGMGEVYRAVDTRLRRKVALKVLRPDRDNEEAVQRLFREARSAAVLTHPNTVAIHDIGEAEGIFYIVMELVTGSSLLAYVGDARVPAARKLAWLVDVARALSAAHKAGVIHRDVKPSNVMVSDDDVVKVLDFGLAKPIAPVSFRTMDGHVLGTPRYMAPEQLAGAEVDSRTDQYAFGLTAYELVAGRHPGGALAGGDPPPALDSVVPEVSRAVGEVIARTMAPDPARRFVSMDDVAVALEDAMAGRPQRVAAAPLAAPREAERSEVTVLEAEAPRVTAAPKTPLADTVRFENVPLPPGSTAVTTKRAGGDGAKVVAKLEGSAPSEVAVEIAEPARHEEEESDEDDVPTATARTVTHAMGDLSPRATTLSDPEMIEKAMPAATATTARSPEKTLLSREVPTPLAQVAAGAVGTTLVAAGNDVEAAMGAIKAVEAKRKAEEAKARADADADADGRGGGKRRRAVPTVAIALVVLGGCAFLGAYYGSKELARVPEPPALGTSSAVLATSASASTSVPSASASTSVPRTSTSTSTSTSATTSTASTGTGTNRKGPRTQGSSALDDVLY